MNDTMKKPSRTKRNLRVVKPETSVHAHLANSDLQQMIDDIEGKSRKELRRELRDEHKIDPDAAVERIQSSVNDAIRLLRRKLHRPEEKVAKASSC